MNLSYFHFPHINDDSYLAAHATECAGEQGSFWQYHDNLYEKQGEGGRGLERLEGFAEDLALDTGRFSACMEARTYDGVIQRDINLALRNEVSVTPTIFVLSTDPNQTGTKFDGSPSFEEISAVIDELLADACTDSISRAPALAPTPTSASTPPEPTPHFAPFRHVNFAGPNTLTNAPPPTPTPTAVPTPRPTPRPNSYANSYVPTPSTTPVPYS